MCVCLSVCLSLSLSNSLSWAHVHTHTHTRTHTNYSYCGTMGKFLWRDNKVFWTWTWIRTTDTQVVACTCTHTDKQANKQMLILLLIIHYSLIIWLLLIPDPRWRCYHCSTNSSSVCSSNAGMGQQPNQLHFQIFLLSKFFEVTIDWILKHWHYLRFVWLAAIEHGKWNFSQMLVCSACSPL